MNALEPRQERIILSWCREAFAQGQPAVIVLDEDGAVRIHPSYQTLRSMNRFLISRSLFVLLVLSVCAQTSASAQSLVDWAGIGPVKHVENTAPHR